MEKRGIGLRSLQEQIDTTTPGGKRVLHVFGALAELERDLVPERTQAGLSAAQARGRVGGRRPVLKGKKADTALALYPSRTLPVTEICKTLGVKGKNDGIIYSEPAGVLSALETLKSET